MIYALAIVYIALSVPLNVWVTRYYENAWWSMIVYVATTPGLLALFPALAVYSIIYFTAYPDRHAHEIDFYGTDDAKRRLQEYRKACDKRPFNRRLLEGLHVLRYTAPEYPAFSDADVDRPIGSDDTKTIVEHGG